MERRLTPYFLFTALIYHLDWFMNTYNAGKSFESILPEILAQQAAMASEDDDEDEDDE